MNDKVLKTLEFHKIIDLLQEEAGSDLGKNFAQTLRLPPTYRRLKHGSARLLMH